jgi:hypothetical protein
VLGRNGAGHLVKRRRRFSDEEQCSYVSAHNIAAFDDGIELRHRILFV